MEIILLKEMPLLGKPGQTVTVKDGYAYNFLIPQGWAVPATSGNRIQADAWGKAHARAVLAQKAQAEELAQRLGQVSCVISMPVGEQEKLHGAVTVSDIAGVLKSQGISLDKRQIQLEEPIIHLGEYSVSVKLHPEVTVPIKVQVVRR